MITINECHERFIDLQTTHDCCGMHANTYIDTWLDFGQWNEGMDVEESYENEACF